MPAPSIRDPALIERLYPIAEQATRILTYFAAYPSSFSGSDSELAGRIGLFSAEHVAIVRRLLIETGHAKQIGFSSSLAASVPMLERAAANLEGVAIYLRTHKDRDAVRLVITEPGENSALRNEIARCHKTFKRFVQRLRPWSILGSPLALPRLLVSRSRWSVARCLRRRLRQSPQPRPRRSTRRSR
jgi:hypothetical protein